MSVSDVGEHPVALARADKINKRTSLGSPFRPLGCSKGV